ncbi:bolA-like protein 1 isoform X3 [Triplophysa rosa]|uniref:bolA-like protein 1 isoform X3 n=1 Tax=Triplophysa rosa TaxID=992332 RepID=UPI0025462CBB|nr:bolA-like protein 1 isoform X3 [Triplophysa rosa]
MLSSALRCLRPSCFSLAFSRQLLHHQPHMEHSGSRPVETTIRTKLTQALEPEHLEVLNESHMHAVPPGSESHFRVLVVSPQFESLSLLQRHRLVNEALKEELSTCVHALAIQAKTPQQWSSNPSLAKSPPCLGGSKHDNTMAEKLKCIRADRTVLHRWSLESAEASSSAGGHKNDTKKSARLKMHRCYVSELAIAAD